MYILLCILICALLIKTSLGDLLMVAALWGSVFLLMIGALSLAVFGVLSLIKTIPIEVYTYGLYQVLALFACIKIYNTFKHKNKLTLSDVGSSTPAVDSYTTSDFPPPVPR